MDSRSPTRRFHRLEPQEGDGKVEYTGLVQVEVQSNTKMNVDATAKAHWTSLMLQFEDQYGCDISEEKLPAESYFEALEEENVKAETHLS